MKIQSIQPQYYFTKNLNIIKKDFVKTQQPPEVSEEKKDEILFESKVLSTEAYELKREMKSILKKSKEVQQRALRIKSEFASKLHELKVLEDIAIKNGYIGNRVVFECDDFMGTQVPYKIKEFDTEGNLVRETFGEPYGRYATLIEYDVNSGNVDIYYFDKNLKELISFKEGVTRGPNEIEIGVERQYRFDGNELASFAKGYKRYSETETTLDKYYKFYEGKLYSYDENRYSCLKNAISNTAKKVTFANNKVKSIELNHSEATDNSLLIAKRFKFSNGKLISCATNQGIYDIGKKYYYKDDDLVAYEEEINKAPRRETQPALKITF